MTVPDGERYEGSWIEGRKDGVGFVVTTSGDWFEGIWRNNQVLISSTFYVQFLQS
jgi:hypothetical protein